MKQAKILLGLLLLAVLVVIGWFAIGCPPFSRCPGTRPPKISELKPKNISLKFVGPFDDGKEWANIIAKFNTYKKMPANGFISVSISYKRICNPSCDSTGYDDIIREMQFEGEGPNIFMAFNTWIPKYQPKLKPMPEGMMSINQFENTFARVAADDLIKDGKIYALPFYIDTLALFYNEDKFINERYLNPPENWDDFSNYVEKLTNFNEDGSIKIAGAAFGGGSNIARNQDILMLLVMQNNMGSNKDLLVFNNPSTKPAIAFYTSFTNPDNRFYTWNENQIYSIDAFTQRKTAMMFNYSYGIQNIIKKTNDTLNFKVAPIPQLDDSNIVNYASYWVPVIPENAPCVVEQGISVDCQELAWEFLNFAAQKENVSLYLDVLDKPAANLQLAEEQSSDYYNARSQFAKQVITAKSWDRPDTSKSDKYLEEMIDSIITTDPDKKVSIEQAIGIAKKHILE